MKANENDAKCVLADELIEDDEECVLASDSNENGAAGVRSNDSNEDGAECVPLQSYMKLTRFLSLLRPEPQLIPDWNEEKFQIENSARFALNQH